MSWQKTCFWMNWKVIFPYSNACIIFSCLIFLASWKWDESTSHSSRDKRNTGKVYRKCDSKSKYRFWSLPSSPWKKQEKRVLLNVLQSFRGQMYGFRLLPFKIKAHLWKMKISPKSITIIKLHSFKSSFDFQGLSFISNCY